VGTLGEQASRLHFMLSSIDDQLKQVFNGTTEDECSTVLAWDDDTDWCEHLGEQASSLHHMLSATAIDDQLIKQVFRRYNRG